MRTISSVFALSLFTFSVSALAVVSKNECAWRVSGDKQISSECEVSMTGTDGKVYCFGSHEAKEALVKDPAAKANKAKETFGRT